MVEVLIGSTPAGQRIDELHVWIGLHLDGAEGIISADMQIAPGVVRHTPLMSSKPEVAERLRAFAERIRGLSEESSNPLVAIRLDTFRRVQDPAPGQPGELPVAAV